MNHLHHTTQDTGHPLISFIIACYNLPADMLCQCIDSILCLSLRAFEREIILIDDGSAHAPLEALADRADHIIYIRQRNQGLSVARNTALRMATGEYVQFIDGDDYLIQSPYEHCLDIARYTDIDMVLFRMTSTEGSPTSYTDAEERMNGAAYMRRNNLHGSACSYLFRRAILGQLRFTPGIYHEDEEFTPLLMLRAEQVLATTAQAYFYRLRNNSIITTTTPEVQEKKQNDMKDIIIRLNTLSETLPIVERMALQRRVAQLTMDLIYNVIMQTKSYEKVETFLEELRAKGLFPLPDHDYTKKYKLFRIATNSTIGLRFLVSTLPFSSRER